jgi:type II secretory pathway pseudopilin PulG
MEKETPMTRSRFRRTLAATGGFTLAEIILVVAVMAILVSLSTPPLIEFMKRRDIQAEQNAENDIMKAIKAYLADRNTLPSDSSTTWANEFAAYTNLSANQISTDTWGNPRVYVMYQVPSTFLGTPINIYYVTLHSMGPNRKADGGSDVAGNPAISNSTSGIPASNGAFASLTDGGWWKNKGNDQARVDAFIAAQPAVDDMMVRMTDYPEKIARYKTSLERMQKIAEALETYSKTQYNERVVECTTSPGADGCPNSDGTGGTAPEKNIYYPRSLPSDGTNPSSYYGKNVENDLATYNGGSAIYNDDGDPDQRRTAMINLMRILGLPDEYCCNALEVIPGEKNEMPFYYFSNPKPRTGTGSCSPRPNPLSGGRTLPARLTVESNNQNPGICG